LDTTRFQDKVCIVTGAGSGIGRATAVRLAQEGGLVAVVDLNGDSAEAAAKEIMASGKQAISAECDVSQEDQVERVVASTLQKWNKGIDVLVNDAAMMTFKPIVDLTVAEWDHVMAVNLRSVFLFCKYCVPHMPQGSAIVNISSVHAHETTVNVVPYATSKGGTEAFIRGFSEELEDRKIRINGVAPGAVNTPMLWNNPNVKSGAEKVEGAIGQPEDLAAAIAFMASSDARFITGTTLIVDGGRLDIL
jgi:glucose 1-dehydrogenase